MKKTLRNLGHLALLGAALALVQTASAASSSTTTSSSNSSTTTVSPSYSGTLNSFGQDNIMVNSQSSSTPMSYGYSSTTTYVDENGNPVARETIRSGTPVTVYYDQNGNLMTASKVVIHQAQPMEIEHKKSSSTTTTTESR